MSINLGEACRHQHSHLPFAQKPFHAFPSLLQSHLKHRIEFLDGAHALLSFPRSAAAGTPCGGESASALGGAGACAKGGSGTGEAVDATGVGEVVEVVEGASAGGTTVAAVAAAAAAAAAAEAAEAAAAEGDTAAAGDAAAAGDTVVVGVAGVVGAVGVVGVEGETEEAASAAGVAPSASPDHAALAAWAFISSVTISSSVPSFCGSPQTNQLVSGRSNISGNRSSCRGQEAFGYSSRITHHGK